MCAWPLPMLRFLCAHATQATWLARLRNLHLPIEPCCEAIRSTRDCVWRMYWLSEWDHAHVLKLLPVGRQTSQPIWSSCVLSFCLFDVSQWRSCLRGRSHRWTLQLPSTWAPTTPLSAVRRTAKLCSQHMLSWRSCRPLPCSGHYMPRFRPWQIQLWGTSRSRHIMRYGMHLAEDWLIRLCAFWMAKTAS